MINVVLGLGLGIGINPIPNQKQYGNDKNQLQQTG